MNSCCDWPTPIWLEADEDADPVIDMHDHIARLEIAQVRQERLCDGSMSISLALDFGAVFFENIRLGDDLQLGAGEPEALGELADRDVHRDVEQLIRAVDEHASQLVFAEEFRRPLGTPFRACDEQDGVAALPHPFDFGDPLLDTPTELHRGLAGNVQRSPVGRSLPNRKLLEPSGGGQPIGHVRPVDDQIFRRRCVGGFGLRIRIAQPQLLHSLLA